MPKNTQSKTKTKSLKTTKATKITKPKKVEQKNSIKEIFKFGESYTSLILGIIFVVIITVILLTFVKGKNIITNTQDTKQTAEAQLQVTITPELTKKVIEQKNITITPTKKPEQKKVTIKTTVTPTEKMQKSTVKGSTYVVKTGDTLWSIAESKYNSGYNWVDIQKANSLTNPGMLYAGTKLILPDVQTKTITAVTPSIEKQQVVSSIQTTNKISGTSYTIQKGDSLWDIAVRAYGDGYAWTKIAKANNLNSPSTIHAGNKITIPRE